MKKILFIFKYKFMAQNILPKTPPISAAAPERPKHKISAIGIILVIFLFIVLILLGERIIFDLNRVANPVVKTSVSSSNLPYESHNYSSYSYERSGLSNTKVYYKQADKSEYIMYKLLIHGAFIIPIFLLVFLFYYLYNIKQVNPHLKFVLYSYFCFAFWMMLHLLGEVGRYIIEEFENAAIYIILGVLALILTPLAIFIQKKVNQHAE